MSEFKWTDELVAEFTSWSLSQAPAFQGRYADIEQFKKSKEVKPKEERIKVGKMSCAEFVTFGNSDLKWQLSFKTNKYIHYDHAPDICNLLERYLNKEMNNPAPPIQEYEILSFKGLVDTNKGLFNVSDNGLYFHENWKNRPVRGIDLEVMLKEVKDIAIHSVRRNSDSVVFSLGDKVEYTTCENWNKHVWVGNIKSIKFGTFDNHKLIFEIQGTNENDTANKYIENIRHSKAPSRTVLFTTEDGIKIYEGDKYWVVYLDFDIKPYPAVESAWLDPKNKRFKSEDNAKEYVLMNKPIFSAKDVLANWDSFYLSFQSKIKSLAKEKLKL